MQQNDLLKIKQNTIKVQINFFFFSTFLCLSHREINIGDERKSKGVAH
jgi:hypothetical protein